MLRLIWYLVGNNFSCWFKDPLRTILISRNISLIFQVFPPASTNKFASTFGIWARKKHNFLLHWKFLVLSTQQKCTGNKRNKTSRLSTFFCTKKLQNPFSSLGERVVWSCVGGFKKVPKTKTHTHHAYMGYVFVKVTYRVNTYMIYVFSFLRCFWNHPCNFKQLVLQDYWMDFDVFWCKMKKRFCLFLFFSLLPTFVELKTTKTSTQVKKFVLFRYFLQMWW